MCLFSKERLQLKWNYPALIVARNSECNPLLSNYKFSESNPRPVSDIPKSLEDSREEYKWIKMLLLSFSLSHLHCGVSGRYTALNHKRRVFFLIQSKVCMRAHDACRHLASVIIQKSWKPWSIVIDIVRYILSGRGTAVRFPQCAAQLFLFYATPALDVWAVSLSVNGNRRLYAEVKRPELEADTRLT
jgi:hypothetical protein